MKTELRIGNWVKIDSVSTQNQVTQILEKGVNCGSIGVLYEMIKPIPLTEEWLERFGFNKINHIHNGVIWCHSKIKITWYSNGMIDLRGSAGWQRIYYVHALQNLYHALTGEELQWS